jgi:hypothetical protein
VIAGKLHRADHGGVCSEITGAAMAGPTFQRAETRDAFWLGERIDAGELHHLCEARKACDAMGAHTIAIRFGDEARGEHRARRRETERAQDALDALPELVEGDANHAFIRTQVKTVGANVYNGRDDLRNRYTVSGERCGWPHR